MTRNKNTSGYIPELTREQFDSVCEQVTNSKASDDNFAVFNLSRSLMAKSYLAGYQNGLNCHIKNNRPSAGTLGRSEYKSLR